jgi:hypothetical protein
LLCLGRYLKDLPRCGRKNRRAGTIHHARHSLNRDSPTLNAVPTPYQTFSVKSRFCRITIILHNILIPYIWR